MKNKPSSVALKNLCEAIIVDPVNWQNGDVLEYKSVTTKEFTTGKPYRVDKNDGEYISVRFSPDENPARFSIDCIAKSFSFLYWGD